MDIPISPQPRVIRSRQDLKKETDSFHESVSKLMDATDKKLEQAPDLDQWHRGGGDLLAKAFHAEEDALRKALAHFEKTIHSCQIAPDLSEGEKSELGVHFEHLMGLLDSVQDLTAKKFTKARARLLTKYLWEEIAFLKDLSIEAKQGKTEFIERLREKFDPNRFKEFIEIYRQTMDELDMILKEPISIRGDIQMTLKKGRILETKEDLLLAFTELKHVFSDKISLFFLASQEVRSYEDLKNQEILDKVHSRLRPERSTIEKVLEKLFTKKLISNPNAIAQLSLSLAATSKVTGKTPAQAMGASSGLLSVGFALPVSAFSIYKTGHSMWRHREAARDLRECQDIFKHAQLMVNQGQTMRTNAQKVILADSSVEEVELAHKTLEQGTRLLALGSDLQEKASLNIEELKSEKARMKAQMFIFGTLTASQLATAASGVGTMLKSLVASFSTTAAATTLNWVGIAGAGLGVVLGTVGMAMNLKGLHDDQKKIGLLAVRSKKLDQLNLKMPNQALLHDLTVIETHLNLVEAEALKISQRNNWISFASNAFLVVAGVLGIAALLASGVASGGLTYAVIGVLVLVTVIAVSHFFLKRRWLQKIDNQINRDKADWNLFLQDLIRKIQWSGKDKLPMVEIMNFLEIPTEKREAFALNPEGFLKRRYQLLLEGRK
ncbi:hypothetical protein [Simkania negevensis]|uniref:Uncharacterized protein n=1 Tax=Simkania negevensis (strain ATCC VR-1471 / DSM 27360 / Z) TaxID=331113 RepID=F8L5H9_SIMNZ|nr:hypothetical protein [Simkania negevensis]CCB89454.1 unknown protein [Simkania negevensis Z]